METGPRNGIDLSDEERLRAVVNELLSLPKELRPSMAEWMSIVEEVELEALANGMTYSEISKVLRDEQSKF